MIDVSAPVSVVLNTIKLYDCTVEAKVTTRGGLYFIVHQCGEYLDTYAHLEHAIKRCIDQ